MFLAKRPGGMYYLYFHDELGRRHCVSTRTRLKAEALKFLQTFRAEERERRVKLKRLSLSEFKNAFLQHAVSVYTAKTVESHETALIQFQRAVGDAPLHKIGVREIETFLAKKRAEASEWTARKYYLALASAFETARRWGHITSNPFRQVQKPKTPELVPAFLSKADFATLMKFVQDAELRALVFCAVSTGMRQGELLALRWDSVDLARRVITVGNSAEFTTKNGRTRTIPMTETLWKLMLCRREAVAGETALVFHSGGLALPADRVSKAFKAALRGAKLSDRLHFHSLRHTFASWLAQDGVSLFAIQKLLGHSSGAVTQVYSHLQPEQMHETVNRLALALN